MRSCPQRACALKLMRRIRDREKFGDEPKNIKRPQRLHSRCRIFRDRWAAFDGVIPEPDAGCAGSIPKRWAFLGMRSNWTSLGLPAQGSVSGLLVNLGFGEYRTAFQPRVCRASPGEQTFAGRDGGNAGFLPRAKSRQESSRSASRQPNE